MLHDHARLAAAGEACGDAFGRSGLSPAGSLERFQLPGASSFPQASPVALSAACQNAQPIEADGCCLAGAACGTFQAPTTVIGTPETTKVAPPKIANPAR